MKNLLKKQVNILLTLCMLIFNITTYGTSNKYYYILTDGTRIVLNNTEYKIKPSEKSTIKKELFNKLVNPPHILNEAIIVTITLATAVIGIIIGNALFNKRKENLKYPSIGGSIIDRSDTAINIETSIGYTFGGLFGTIVGYHITKHDPVNNFFMHKYLKKKQDEYFDSQK